MKKVLIAIFAILVLYFAGCIMTESEEPSEEIYTPIVVADFDDAEELDNFDDAAIETPKDAETILQINETEIADQEDEEKGEKIIDHYDAAEGINIVSELPVEDSYCTISDNIPSFAEKDISTQSFEYYSDLDEYGRCGICVACIGRDLMPTEDRGIIGQIKPTGWHTIKYNIVDGKYLYNRCHLIGYQLSGENSNEKNLITGTRYLNVVGMLPFENMVADYVQSTGNHVMYRVVPDFEGENLVASGVQIEALSVEDSGKGICFNVYCYNVQPGIGINYENGSSWLDDTAQEADNSISVSDDEKDVQKIQETPETQEKTDVAENANNNDPESIATDAANSSKVTVPGAPEDGENLVWVPTNGGTKYHNDPSCSKMKDPMQVTKETAIANGYTPCKRCYS